MVWLIGSERHPYTVKKVQEANIHRPDCVRAKIPQDMIDLGQGIRKMFTIRKVGCLEIFPGMQIVEGEASYTDRRLGR
jgi:hypothetical protein